MGVNSVICINIVRIKSTFYIYLNNALENNILIQINIFYFRKLKLNLYSPKVI